jgi:hypothetical protein
VGAVRRPLAGGGAVSVILLPNGVPVSEIADPVGVLRAAGILMSEEAEQLDAIVRASHCLIRIDGIGERWRCRGCNGQHEFFTLGCIPRPFRGLRDGLRAYWQNTAVPAADLSPDQRERRAEAGKLLGFEAPLPSLATHHPEAARQVATRPGSLDIGAWVLGVVEPISTARARLYAARINSRARRTIVRL